MAIWQAGRFCLDVSQAVVMGIVNVTPDSFSDGGQYSQSVGDALRHAEQLLKDGAAILDIGGESTRSGAAFVSPEDEWRRIEPVLAEVSRWNVPLSVDTRRSSIMQRALDKGWADIINDVQGLEDEGALALLADAGNTGICLMHMQGLPQTMQHNPSYADVVAEVGGYLQQRLVACRAAGIADERVLLDPGFGFGKTLAHNIALMQHLPKLQAQCGRPMLIGVSRKSMIGELTGREVAAERVSGSVAAALFAAEQGAAVLRVHDVRETVDALRVWRTLRGAAVLE